MKQFFLKNWVVIIVLLSIILLRIKLSLMSVNGDLLTISEWGRQANLRGTLKGFYDWGIWDNSYPGHPPLISWFYFMIYPLHSKLMCFLSNLGNFIALHRLAPTKFMWLYSFANWFGLHKHGTTLLLSGIIVLIKQFMILADLLIGGVIFYICKKNKVNWKKYVFVYLLLPFSWYLSSVWGQSDQLSFLFLIIAFILLTSKKYSGISPLIYVIAANLKPNCILLLPVFLYAWYKQKQSFGKLILGGLVAIIFSFWTVSWFTDKNVFIYAVTVILKKVSTDGGLINFNAFNFWYIFYPFSKSFISDTNIYWILSAKNWGWLMVLITTLLSLKVIKYKKLESIFAAMFIAGFGSWLFMTGMHERYSFLAIIPLLLVSIYKKNYFKYFLILSIIYTFNLFIAYLPWNIFSWTKNMFEFSDFLIPRMLSLANLILYVRVTYLMIKNHDK
ncbi:MAG: hypothetical protein WCX33_01185 [Candidatus Shapirobacteria bacterium]